MTQEEKDLLLQDLCARLPYRVFIRPEGLDGYELLTFEPVPDLDVITGVNYLQDDEPTFITEGSEYEIGDFKPYLRPMSSMTKEEKETYQMFFNENGLLNTSVDTYIDWLLEGHFDFRGLIPMGLALEAPEDMYKFE